MRDWWDAHSSDVIWLALIVALTLCAAVAAKCNGGGT